MPDIKQYTDSSQSSEDDVCCIYKKTSPTRWRNLGLRTGYGNLALTQSVYESQLIRTTKQGRSAFMTLWSRFYQH